MPQQVPEWKKGVAVTEVIVNGPDDVYVEPAGDPKGRHAS